VNNSFIIDAHTHIDSPGIYFTPRFDCRDLIDLMDLLGIRVSICSDHFSIFRGSGEGLERLLKICEESAGRIYGLAVFDPRKEGDLPAIRQRIGRPGLVGIKIHPSFHRTEPESPAYEPIWRLAAENDLPILTHSWSVSEHNPSQRYSTPERFEHYIKRYPSVRLVLGHAGGRGTGRGEMVRMVNTYPNVYTDIAGDIFCLDLIESLVRQIPAERILFGSDFPWLDPRANLTRIYLSEISVHGKQLILQENAQKVYRIP